MFNWIIDIFYQKKLEKKLTKLEIEHLKELGYTSFEIFNVVNYPSVSYFNAIKNQWIFIYHKDIQIKLEISGHKVRAISLSYKNNHYTLTPIQVFNLTRNKAYSQYTDLSRKVLEDYCTKIKADKYVYICQSIENIIKNTIRI